MKSFSCLRQILIASETSKEPLNVMIPLEDLMLEIRKDLGHNNKNINRGEILSLFINDVYQNI